MNPILSGSWFVPHGLWLIRLLTLFTGKLPFITDLLSEHNIHVRFKADLDPSSPATLPSGSCSFFHAPYTIGPVHEVYVLFADTRLFFLPFFTNTQLSILFHQDLLIPSTLPCCHHLLPPSVLHPPHDLLFPENFSSWFIDTRYNNTVIILDNLNICVDDISNTWALSSLT